MNSGTRLRRLFSSVVGGSWGSEPGTSSVDLPCIRGTDFDMRRLRVDLSRAPIRSFGLDEVQVRAARSGDLIIEKSGGSEQQPVGRVVLWDGDRSVMPTNFAARLRVDSSADPRFVGFLLSSMWADGRTRGAINQTTGLQNLDTEAFFNEYVTIPSLTQQQRIADYLDTQTSRIAALIGTKQRIVSRLYERCDAQIRNIVGESPLVDCSERGAVPVRRVLAKRRQLARPGTEMITAYRDGQVTLRALRRPEGYTEGADGASLQGVELGDVVVHGLDGFAGAIGTSEAAGACSPVYHVCQPLKDGDPHFWGRMLRVLALTGYLSLFVTSTRERAFDMRNWETFGRIQVPVASPCEQERIGNLVRALAPINNLVNCSITLLEERRQALIRAAVTGELVIPDAA